MASVRKLKPDDPKSPWIVEYTDEAGKRRRKTPKSGLKKDADAIRLRIERELGEGVHCPDAETATLSKVCDDYLSVADDRAGDGRLGFSRHEMLHLIVRKSLVPLIGGDRLMKDISVAHLEGAYRAMVKKVAPRTAKERIQAYKQIEDFALARGLLKKGVTSLYLLELRGVIKPAVRTFSRDNLDTLLDTLADRRHRTAERTHRMMRCVVQLAAFCGLRHGEIMALRVENIDLKNLTIKVQHSLTRMDIIKGPKTRSGLRDVPLPSQVAEEIGLWLARDYIQEDRGLVFRAKEAKFISGSHFHNIYWRPLLKHAGLLAIAGPQLHFHALRHFYASWLISKGLSVTEVAELLGHKHFDVTLQTYAHPMMGARQRNDLISGMISDLVRPVPVALSIRHDVGSRCDENATFPVEDRKVLEQTTA